MRKESIEDISIHTSEGVEAHVMEVVSGGRRFTIKVHSEEQIVDVAPAWVVQRTKQPTIVWASLLVSIG